eukprot:9226556-Pyramimonas_sp.AAC.1
MRAMRRGRATCSACTATTGRDPTCDRSGFDWIRQSPTSPKHSPAPWSGAAPPSWTWPEAPRSRTGRWSGTASGSPRCCAPWSRRSSRRTAESGGGAWP